MNMYGYDASIYDYGFSDPAISGSIYGNSISPMAAAIDYDDELYVRRMPPPRQRPPSQTPSSPPKRRHDGLSPLPLGMDWSLPPQIWEGRNFVWPHDLHKGWSYCVTIPSISSEPSLGSSDTVFYDVKVGIQSPEGITTSRTVPRRFNEFLKLYSELKKEFPKKNLPPIPSKGLMKAKTKKVLEDRMCALESWMTKLLSDIDVSRTAPVAIFLELEAAAREAELNDCFEEKLIKDWRSRKKVQIFQYVVLKWTLVLLIGIATGLVAFFNNIAVENIAGFKLLLTGNLMLKQNYYQAFAALAGCNVVLATCAAVLCAYIAPAAAGKGI